MVELNTETFPRSIEPLTRREQEILRLLADERLSNQEIAERLTITANSVKWYTHQIYQKLGVNERKQALARARALDLLPPSEEVQVAPSAGLPAELTPFIGREDQVAQVSRMLREEGMRLVTLTGAGGVGKTRLALKVAETLEADYPHGARLVELAGVTDGRFISDTLAAAFGINAAVARGSQIALRDYLREKRLLLVLDNCEHLLEPCAQLVERLLKDCRRLHILVTSREALNIEGEDPFVVPSLSFPPASNHLEENDLSRYEAVQLFVERARLAQPGFAITRGNARAVARICQKLDGIPLALEMAAARLKALNVIQVADRLEASFNLLTGGSRTAMPRHKTMRASIEWSCNLLSKAEQILLRRISIFTGGWTLEAAEHVCAGQQVTKDQMMDLLGELVDKSLVQFKTGDDVEPRYQMLEVIRQYALEKLVEAGEEDALRERHLYYYVWLAQQAEPHLRAHQARQWMDRLESELGNLRAALTHALAGRLRLGLDIAASLMWFWWIRNHSVEGMTWLDQLLHEQNALAGSLEPADKISRGKALLALGHLIFNNKHIGSLPHFYALSEKELLQESQVIFEQAGPGFEHYVAVAGFIQAESAADFLECRGRFLTLHEPFWVAECDKELVSLFIQNWRSGATYYERFSAENLAIHREIGDLDGEGKALQLSGVLAFYQGDLDRAIGLMKESQACFERIKNYKYRGVINTKLAEIEAARGCLDEAERLIRLALAEAVEINDPRLLLMARSHQVALDWARGEDEWAAQSSLEILEGNQHIALPPKFLPLHVLSRVALRQGRFDQVRIYLHGFLPAVRSSTFILGKSIQLLGLLACREGRAAAAATFFGAQAGLCGWMMNTFLPREREEYEAALAEVRTALEEAAFNRAWETGRAMTEEQALAYAAEALAG